MKKILTACTLILFLVTNLCCYCDENYDYDGYGLLDKETVSFGANGGVDSIIIMDRYTGKVQITDAVVFDWHGEEVQKTHCICNEAKDSVKGDWFTFDKGKNQNGMEYYKITVSPNTTGLNRYARINVQSSDSVFQDEIVGMIPVKDIIEIYQDAR